MADRWLQLEVLQELDDANATYFALTLGECTSHHYLEIPATFTAKTGWPSCEDCALVTSISTRKEWPLRIRRLPDAHRGISAVSIGGGWARFIADQHLGVGAFLTFEVVDSRRLVVALHRCSAPTDYSPLHQHRFDAALVRDCLQREPPEVDTLNPMPSDSLSSVRGNDRPHFQKMLRKAHMKKYASSKLDIPTAYWRTYGMEGFDGRFCTFNGPLAPWTVNTDILKYATQTFCAFTTGWAGFCTANNLKVGDVFIFTKVGLDEFEVRKA